jgi:hypothetical protein
VKEPTLVFLLKVNLGIGCFGLLVDTAAVLLVMHGKGPADPRSVASSVIALILSVVLVGSAVIGIAKDARQRPVLALHALIFAGTAIWTAGWGLHAIGLSREALAQAGMHWSVGWLTARGVYAAYLAKRTFLEEWSIRARLGAFFIVPIGLGLFAIDALIFAALTSKVI